MGRLPAIHYKLVSRILFLNYHLSGPSITAGIYLPTRQLSVRIGRAALNNWHTWHFSMQGLPPLQITL